MSAQILVIEDEPLSQSILVNLLGQAGHHVTVADTGAQAWMALSELTTCDAILLDRSLPDMNGLDLLKRIQQDAHLAQIPVIINTAMVEPEDILEGLRAGAYYYVTKPIQQEPLLAIVDSAVRQARAHRSLKNQIHQTADVLHLMERGEFRFRTPEQVQSIASLLCNACPDGNKVGLGLSELMLNAIEHGNLGIDYHEKSQLVRDGRLWDEIEARLNSPDYADKYAVIAFDRVADEIRFTIRDQGRGFDWRHYLNMSPERAFHTHGRGIAMAKMMSFSEINYQDPGNEVVAICRLSANKLS